MARTFNGSSDYVDFSQGNVGPVDQAATGISFVAVARADTIDGTEDIVGVFGSEDWGLRVHSINGELAFFSNAGSHRSGSGFISAGTWYLIGGTCGSGTSTPRLHKYEDGVGFSHVAAGFSANRGAGTHTVTRAGRGETTAYGSVTIEAFMIVESDLGDAGFEDCIGYQNWAGKSPSGIWLFDQGNVATSVDDETGGGADQSAINGTTVATGPSWFTDTYAGGGGSSAAQHFFLRGIA